MKDFTLSPYALGEGVTFPQFGFFITSLEIKELTLCKCRGIISQFKPSKFYHLCTDSANSKLKSLA